MPLTLINFIIYIAITWGTNIALNFLYVAKRYIPEFEKVDIPIDGYIKYKNHRLVGSSTTIAGFIVSLIIAIVLLIFTKNITYTLIPILVYIGHMIGSIIKRRMGKDDGVFVPFLDHGDYMLLTGVVLVATNRASLYLALSGIIFTYIFHPIACIVAFHLKLRKYPY